MYISNSTNKVTVIKINTNCSKIITYAFYVKKKNYLETYLCQSDTGMTWQKAKEK